MSNEHRAPPDFFYGKRSPDSHEHRVALTKRTLPRVLAMIVGVVWVAFLVWLFS